jgi:hypothetical protein
LVFYSAKAVICYYNIDKTINDKGLHIKLFLSAFVFFVLSGASAMPLDESPSHMSNSNSQSESSKERYSGAYDHDYSTQDYVNHARLFATFNFTEADKIIERISEKGIGVYNLSNDLEKGLIRILASKCSPSQFKQLISLDLIDVSNASTYAKFLITDDVNEAWLIEKFEMLKNYGVDLNSIKGKMNVNGDVVYLGQMDKAARFGYVGLLTYLSKQSLRIELLEIAWMGVLFDKQKSYAETARKLIELGYTPDAALISTAKSMIKQGQTLGPEIETLLRPYLSKDMLIN